MLAQLNDTYVIVRAANERTALIATRLARAQLTSKDDITVVTEVPFEGALRATYLTALKAGKKWTMTLDADVLLAPNAITGLTSEAEQMPSHYVQIEGRILDKITGMYRQAGHRIYRTELLQLALQCIPKPGAEIRPEFFVLQQMGRLGHPSRRISQVSGLHDYEQYYRDLYRKSFVHAKKHTMLVAGIVERCSFHLKSDPDFLVILKGLWDGLLYRGSVSIDTTKFVHSSGRVLAELGLREKNAILDEKQFEISFLNQLRLANSDPAPTFDVVDDPPAAATLSSLQKFRLRTRKHGFAKGTLSCVGAILKRCGNLLED